MISIVKDICIDKMKWIEDKEFVDVVAIAESTPGPIAINLATYIGYKKAGLVGSLFATIGVVLPSFIVICIITTYLSNFLKIKIISDAFFGIRIAVSIIIIKTSYNLIKSELKSSHNKNLTKALFLIYTVVLLIININNIDISTVLITLIAFAIGVVLLIIGVDKTNDIS